ncbi:MAG TPA: sigma 54-interacting transcriptional regulator, partial [Candidatus Sulfomarinibacteraceae bacterium]|nr:sigma 54-interacting transcriptional regulator [Candidatus Sulfomarinibacteraceae bacterium]
GFLDLVHPDCREVVIEAVRCAEDDGSPVDIEYRFTRRDGDQRWAQSCGRLQPVSAVRPERLLGATIDVTARKTAEDELRRSFEEVNRLSRQLELENAYLKQEQRVLHGGGRLVGESPALMEVLALVERVAPTASTVLIEGETGTGKDLVAHRIHELSPRCDRPLVKVNCAALPSNLVETELFGREKGAYTGAVSRESGRFEIADGGTLMLDEVAELPLELQSKLLRVLEDGEFERVGSSKTRTTDVRVIAATNRDLEAEVEAGRFRRDLFFRLAVFPIRVPPLRERRQDIPLLVWAMVEELGSAMNRSIESIRKSDLELLQAYTWPGNVRELRNVVERALILCTGSTLRIQPPETSSRTEDLVLSLDEAQRRHILRVFELTGGQIRGSGGAAELLGVKATTLRSRMERLGIDPKSLRGTGASPRRE